MIDGCRRRCRGQIACIIHMHHFTVSCIRNLCANHDKTSSKGQPPIAIDRKQIDRPIRLHTREKDLTATRVRERDRVMIRKMFESLPLKAEVKLFQFVTNQGDFSRRCRRQGPLSFFLHVAAYTKSIYNTAN